MSVREYKSSVFTMLEETPEYALSTYNALNGTNYEDPGMVTIQKVKGRVLLSIRNDASFLLDMYFNMYEHQSTPNPNMPLRFMLYFSEYMWDYVKVLDYDIYGRRRIPIPTPKFVVFYNGKEERPEREEFHLSDSYEHKCECYDLDLSCVVYNINPGFNEELQQKSRVFVGYTTFVEKVRAYENGAADLRAAINRAIDECITEDILAEFFKSRRAEVLEMAVLDFTFERREELIARDSREEGIELGRSQGRTEGIELGRSQGRTEGIELGRSQGRTEEKSQVAEKMLKANKPFEEIMEFTGLSADELKELANKLGV